MGKQPNFIIDVDDFRIVQDEAGIGRIVVLPDKDVALVAPHIEHHPDTLYAACSGIPLPEGNTYFRHGESVLGVEWARHETNPKGEEPEVNVYRYLIGISQDGTSCHGYEVTKRNSGDGQVAEHHIRFEDVFNRHFPEESK